MAQTSATAQLLSDVADALRDQLNAEKLRTRHLEEQLVRVQEARKNAVDMNRELRRKLRRAEAEVAGLRKTLELAGGV